MALGLVPAAAHAESEPAPAPAPTAGPQVLEDRPELVEDVAEANDLTSAEAEELLADETTQVSENGTVQFVEPTRAGDINPVVPLGGIAPYAETLKLHSRPGSSRTIFLDFDGHTMESTVWPADDRGPYDALPYDSDGSMGFSLRERDEIQYMWRQVAEDFAALDVDVTTEEPSPAALRRDSAADLTYGTRVVITNSWWEDFSPYATAVASYKAFDAVGADWDARGPGAFVFGYNLVDNPKLIAEVTSHEVGHTLGLRHDGTTAGGYGSYYFGHGAWGPIMGAAYERAVGQWSKGEYGDANNLEDDLAVMATHGVAPLADDHTNARGTATALSASVRGSGTITAGADADLFAFVAPATGNRTFTATPSPVVANLDLKLTLLSANGTVLDQVDPPAATTDGVVATGLDATITRSVTAGTTYYLRVEAASHLTPATGWSTYGSIGPYTVSTAAGGTPTCTSQDTIEPNDTTRTATKATSGQAITSRLCGGNLDYYALPVLAGQTINAALQFTNQNGNLDAALLDPAGATVALSATNGNGESISHVATESGTYTVEVASRDRASNAYSVTLTSPLCAPDDGYEENDTFATAKPATKVNTLFGASCAGDPDWFSVPVAAGEVIEARVVHDHRFGALGVEIVDGSGTSVALNANGASADQATATAPAAASSGTWRVRVIPGSGANGYALTIRSSAPVPTAVSAVAGPGSATISWTPPASDGGSPITGYEVGVFQGGVLQWTKATTGSPLRLSGPSPGVTYTFAVRTINGTGASAWSAPSNAVVPTAWVVPDAPTGLIAIAGDGFVRLKWIAPFDGGPGVAGPIITPYINGVAQTPKQEFGGAPRTTLYGLTNGTTYTFTVAVTNNVGAGPPSAMSAPVTPATTPSSPTGVTAVAGDGRATVSWTAPTSNGGLPITSYEVTPYLGINPLPPVTTAGPVTSTVVPGLANGSAYTFEVSAANAAYPSLPSERSAPVTPKTPYAPFASWSAFVTRQYVDLTTKPPSSAALSTWVSQLNAGTKTKGDLDDVLRRGPENLANVDPVVRVYRAFLGRAPDAGGLQFWIKRKRNVAPAKTWTVTQIATEFTNSNEFKTKYGSLTNRQFVTQIYTDVLGRAADTNGVNYWTGKLDRKEKTKAQVVVGFSESNEYKTKQAQNTDVAVAYIYLLGRAPTTTEASDWVTRQKAGTTHATLLTELLTSAGYATRITG